MDQSTELPLVATEGIPDAARRYREQVLRVYNSLSLTGLPERDPRLNQLPLDEIFVPLSIDVNIPPATPDIRDQEQRLKVLETFAHMYQPIEGSGVMEYLGTTGLDALKGEAAMRGSQRRAPVPQRLSVGDAVGRYRRLVVVGAPGSGKTTLLRWLAVTFAAERQAEPDRLGPPFATPYLPIILELRR
ncbi:MAG TPA: hypothetical protein VKI44_04635 [Acetobacteraceae bacterium]|nr:hypothetical protein [Acetobacteraceae bacterium]